MSGRLPFIFKHAHGRAHSHAHASRREKWTKEQRGRLLEDVINTAEALSHGDGGGPALPPMVRTFLQQLTVRCIEDVEYPEPDYQQAASLLTILAEVRSRGVGWTGNRSGPDLALKPMKP